VEIDTLPLPPALGLHLRDRRTQNYQPPRYSSILSFKRETKTSASNSRRCEADTAVSIELVYPRSANAIYSSWTSAQPLRKIHMVATQHQPKKARADS